MNYPRDPEHTIDGESQRLKIIKKLDSKPPKNSSKAGVKSQTQQGLFV